MEIEIGKYYLHCAYDDLDQESFYEVVFVTSLDKKFVECKYLNGLHIFWKTCDVFEDFYREVDKNLVDIMRIMEQ